ncbi:hypothetical protein DMP17_43850, partial [Pseudonocardia sp. TMWB2A]
MSSSRAGWRWRSGCCGGRSRRSSTGLPSLSASIGETVVALRDRLAGPPFRLDDTQLAAVFQSLLDTLQRNQAALANN